MLKGVGVFTYAEQISSPCLGWVMACEYMEVYGLEALGASSFMALC